MNFTMEGYFGPIVDAGIPVWRKQEIDITSEDKKGIKSLLQDVNAAIETLHVWEIMYRKLTFAGEVRITRYSQHERHYINDLEDLKEFSRILYNISVQHESSATLTQWKSSITQPLLADSKEPSVTPRQKKSCCKTMFG